MDIKKARVANALADKHRHTTHQPRFSRYMSSNNNNNSSNNNNNNNNT
jgi:hypothetical protein